MYGRIDHHRLLVGVHVGDLLVHLEEVAVAGLDHILAEPLDSGLEVEEYGQPRFVHTEPGIATLLRGTGSHVAGNEVTEGRITALEVVIPILLCDFGCLLEPCTEFLHVLFFLGHPDTAVVAERLRHERQLALVLAVHGDAGGVDLREAGVGEHGPLLVALPCGRTVGVHRVGREEEDVAVTARGDHDRMCAETLYLARYEVARDDTAGLAVHHHQVEHLVARIALHRPFGDLTVESRVGAEQELLSRLAAGIEGTRYLRTAERTVGEQPAVIACERYTLSHALVDDVVGHLRQTIDVRLTGTVVAALDGVVEEPEYGVVVVLVVLRGIDTALRGDGVRPARGVGDAEYLDVVTEFAQRSSRRGAAEAGTYDDDVEFTLVGRADHFDVGLVFAPLLGNGALRHAGFYLCHILLFYIQRFVKTTSGFVRTG